jgi:hypothetical protein
MERNSKDAAIHPGDGSVKITAVMACFGVVFRSRHVHLDRLNGSRITHAVVLQEQSPSYTLVKHTLVKHTLVKHTLVKHTLVKLAH